MAKIRLTVDIDFDDEQLEDVYCTPEEILEKLKIYDFEWADGALIVNTHDNCAGSYILRNPQIVKREALK